MDPTATVSELRELSAMIVDRDDHLGRMVELWEALDGWMTRGGFRPRQWWDANYQLDKALKYLHNRYGRGDLIRIDHAARLVWFQCTSCVPETARYRVKDQTVHLHGHQRKIGGAA